MRVAFRVDASTSMGTGHVMRCLTLAEEFKRQGHECVFICRDHVGNLSDVIYSRGFVCVLLQTSTGAENIEVQSTRLAHSDWLGVSQLFDANQTIEILNTKKTNLLIIDHYGIDATWEELVTPLVDKLFIIDDLADRNHHADFLLDQNAFDERANLKYLGKVNESCTLLLGPQYALLGGEYAELSRTLTRNNRKFQKVLIFVGGSDPFHLTEKYLDALDDEALRDLDVEVVIGKNHPLPQKVKEIAQERGNTKCYMGLPSLAELMAQSDFMLGAGGGTTWERMSLGLNSIIISVADNQYETSKKLGEMGLINFLGKVDAVTTNDIISAVNDLIKNPVKNIEQSHSMQKLVDGLGCQRVVSKVLEQCCNESA